jgi:hypothetical protein
MYDACTVQTTISWRALPHPQNAIAAFRARYASARILPVPESCNRVLRGETCSRNGDGGKVCVV